MLSQAVNKSIKYTAVIPQNSVDDLRIMAKKKIIPSVNQGIQLAIQEFIKTNKQREYAREIQAAAIDKSFVNRTMDTQHAFEAVDAEIDGQW